MLSSTAFAQDASGADEGVQLGESSQLGATHDGTVQLDAGLAPQISAHTREIDRLKAEITAARESSDFVVKWTTFLLSGLALLLAIAAILGLKEIFALKRHVSDSRDLSERSAAIKDELEAALKDFEAKRDPIFEELSKLHEDFERNNETMVHIVFAATEARNAFHRGDYTRSIELYKTVLDYHPDDIESMCYIGRCHVYIGQDDEAISIFDKARDLASKDSKGEESIAIPLLGLATAYRRKDLLSAIAYARDACNHAPQNAGAHELLGILHRANGDNEAAHTCFDKSFDLKPTHDGAMLVATSFKQRSNELECQRYREKAKALAEADIEAGYRLIWAYMTLWFYWATEPDHAVAIGQIERLNQFRITEYRAYLIEDNILHVCEKFGIGYAEHEEYLQALQATVGPAKTIALPHAAHVTDGWKS